METINTDGQVPFCVLQCSVFYANGNAKWTLIADPPPQMFVSLTKRRPVSEHTRRLGIISTWAQPFNRLENWLDSAKSSEVSDRCYL